MFILDKIVFSWIYKTCTNIGSFFGVGFWGGAFCIILFFAYAYTLAVKEVK